MATVTLDTKGLRCPQPVLRIAAKSPTLSPGDVLVVEADCVAFPQDVKKWCDRMGKTLLAVTTSGSTMTAQIQF